MTHIGPPDSPASPMVATMNLTTLSVSWTAPWLLPLNSYTVTMTNITSSQAIGEWTTTHTNMFVEKTWQSDCDTLEFTVRANTDVGSSSTSQPRITGFPNGKIMTALVESVIILIFIDSL